MIVAPQPVAAVMMIQPNGPVVMAAAGVLAPAVLRANGTCRQKGAWPRVAIGAPPYLSRPKGPPRRSAIALALVGNDAATPQGDRNRLRAGGKPAPAGTASGGADPNRRERPVTQICCVSC